MFKHWPKMWAPKLSGLVFGRANFSPTWCGARKSKNLPAGLNFFKRCALAVKTLKNAQKLFGKLFEKKTVEKCAKTAKNKNHCAAVKSERRRRRFIFYESFSFVRDSRGTDGAHDTRDTLTRGPMNEAAPRPFVTTKVVCYSPTFFACAAHRTPVARMRRPGLLPVTGRGSAPRRRGHVGAHSIFYFF